MAKITHLVIHCTDTPEGRNVTSKDIRAWHTGPISEGGRGWKMVGYTDMFHLDGKVERLVDNNEDRCVDPWEITNGAKGYNTTSRHVVYVGGRSADGKTFKDTRTLCQKTAMARYVKDFHGRFPKVLIVGHNQISTKACPSFSVPQWLEEIGL